MSAGAGMDPIVMEEVSVRFGHRTALAELNLPLAKSVVTAIIGNSGSGKSLALKCAAGLMFPDSGRVLFEGRRISAMSEREYKAMQSRTGFHFQDAALWANKSIKENLSLPMLAANDRMSEDEVEFRVRRALDSVGLDLDPSLRPDAISMGQQKLVSFLRATITKPEILFLDDPDSFLDPAGLRTLRAKVGEFKSRGATIVLATHNRAMCEQMADEVAVLDSGRLVAMGKYSDVMQSTDPALSPILRELSQGADN